MPEISTYMGHVDVDIDIADFLEQCSDGEIDDVIAHLKDDYPQKMKWFKSPLNEGNGLVYETQKKFSELSEHAFKFTAEEETFLNKMYKKYL